MPPSRPVRWIDIQTRTLTRWLNVHISEDCEPVRRIFNDLKDGTALVSVAESLSGGEITGAIRTPTRFEDCKKNVFLFLSYLQREGALPFDVTVEDILNGNKSITLSVVWMLVLQYQLGNARNSRRALMSWVREDWNSGEALCYLCCACLPDVIGAVDVPMDPLAACTLGLRLAQDHMGVPAVLSAPDMMHSQLDEISTMTYLSAFMNCYQTMAAQNRRAAKSRPRPQDMANASIRNKAHNTPSRDVAIDIPPPSPHARAAETVYDRKQKEAPQPAASPDSVAIDMEPLYSRETYGTHDDPHDANDTAMSFMDASALSVRTQRSPAPSTRRASPTPSRSFIATARASPTQSYVATARASPDESNSADQSPAASPAPTQRASPSLSFAATTAAASPTATARASPTLASPMPEYEDDDLNTTRFEDGDEVIADDEPVRHAYANVPADEQVAESYVPLAPATQGDTPSPVPSVSRDASVASLAAAARSPVPTVSRDASAASLAGVGRGPAVRHTPKAVSRGGSAAVSRQPSGTSLGGRSTPTSLLSPRAVHAMRQAGMEVRVEGGPPSRFEAVGGRGVRRGLCYVPENNDGTPYVVHVLWCGAPIPGSPFTVDPKA